MQRTIELLSRNYKGIVAVVEDEYNTYHGTIKDISWYTDDTTYETGLPKVKVEFEDGENVIFEVTTFRIRE